MKSCQPDRRVPTWLLRARVTPPRHLHSLIRRERVIKALTAPRREPIVVLAAPPGFGKSAVLGQWVQEQAITGGRSAWLTLDSTDDPDSAVQYLAFAFQVSGLDLSCTELLDERCERPVRGIRALQSLLACVEQSGDEWLLVLDDFQRASGSVVCDVLEPLIRFMPASVTLAIAASGANIDLDLSDVANRGLVRTLGPRELRFNRDEVRAIWGRSASTSQVRLVEQRTSGWPVLVQLMREHGSVLRFVAAPSAVRTVSAVTSFIESSILKPLDEHTRWLILRLSILPCFNTELVEELFKIQNCAVVMGSLESTGIISRLSSDEPMDMAIRPLFREYLAERFVTTDPNGARDVQYAAAHAYLRRDSHVQAVRLAVATGDIDFIGNIVEACDPLSLFSEHGLERLRQIARLVPMSVARQRPRVGYVCAICWIKVGRLKDAQELYDVLEPVVTWSRIQSDTPDPAVLIERAFCHSMLAIYKGTPISEQDVTTLDTLSTCGREPSPQVSSMVATLRCYLLHHASAFREAKEAAHQSIRDAVTARSPYMEFFSYCELGMISGVEGATSDAFGFFEQVQRTCRATIRADERLALIRDAFKLELQHEIDPTRHSSVNRLRNICLRLPHLEGWLDVFAAVYRTYSEKLFLAGDLPAALAVLSVGIEHCSKQKIEGTPTILLAQRAFLLACAGRVTEAAGELTALHAGFANDLRCWRESEAFVEATAALDLVRGSCGPTSLLHDAIERAKRTGNVRSELRFRQLRWAFGRAGGVAEGLGDDDVNIRNLEARSGFRRAGVFVGRCLAAIESIDRPQISPVEIPTYSAGFLTPRQVSVLMKVNQGLADKSIAIELGISAHGVRYHLKRIYLKLHARDRQEACTKAGQLGIIRRPTDSFDSFRTTSAAEARP